MKTSAAQVWTCVLFVWFLKKADGKTQDVHVTCQYSEDCVLPCSFTPSGGEEIRWFRRDALIYSHPQGTNRPDELFIGRTSISAHKLSLGNASLILQRCVLKDRGRYRCEVTKGGKMDSFVVLKVEAPIRSVNLKITRLSGFEEVKCSTCDVYPAPHVFWSTDPPTPVEELKYTTRKMADKHGLYVIDSRLKRLGQRSKLTYICIVNSSSAAQTWTTSLTETVHNNVTLISMLYAFSTWTEINSAEGQDITIPCRSPWNLQNFTLTWSFTTANMSTIIYTYDSKTQEISNRWNGTAWLEPQSVQEGDGSLRLCSIQNLEHIGVYTCNVSAVQKNYVAQTRVNVTSPRDSEREARKTRHARSRRKEDHRAAAENDEMTPDENPRMHTASRPWWIPVAVVLTLMIIFAAIIVGIVKLQNKCSKTKTEGTARYSKEVKVTVDKGEETMEEGRRLTSDPSKEHT